MSHRCVRISLLDEALHEKWSLSSAKRRTGTSQEISCLPTLPAQLSLTLIIQPLARAHPLEFLHVILQVSILIGVFHTVSIRQLLARISRFRKTLFTEPQVCPSCPEEQPVQKSRSCFLRRAINEIGTLGVGISWDVVARHSRVPTVARIFVNVVQNSLPSPSLCVDEESSCRLTVRAVSIPSRVPMMWVPSSSDHPAAFHWPTFSCALWCTFQPCVTQYDDIACSPNGRASSEYAESLWDAAIQSLSNTIRDITNAEYRSNHGQTLPSLF